MFLLDELTETQKAIVAQALPSFEAAIEGKPLRDAIGVAGHFYELALMLYTQAMIAEGGLKTADIVSFTHQLNEGLNKSLVAWARQVGHDYGKNAPSLIQIPHS